MLVSRLVSGGSTGLTTFLRGKEVVAATGGNAVNAYTFTADSSADMGSTGAGVTAGDTLHIFGVGSYLITATPGAGTSVVTVGETIPQATSSNPFSVTRAGVDPRHVVKIVPKDGNQNLVVYEKHDSSLDLNRILVLDRTGGFSTAANAVAAEADATAQTNHINISDAARVDIFIDVLNNNSASSSEFLNLKVRFSGKEIPAKTTSTDWGYLLSHDISSSGISTANELTVKLNLAEANGTAWGTTARSFCFRVDHLSGRWISAIVWSDKASVTGKVYMQRRNKQ
tara:strand:+ start:208 stop:1059 length:852 start_codon:yes stop_codon:yes gene_type:complete